MREIKPKNITWKCKTAGPWECFSGTLPLPSPLQVNILLLHNRVPQPEGLTHLDLCFQNTLGNMGLGVPHTGRLNQCPQDTAFLSLLIKSHNSKKKKRVTTPFKDTVFSNCTSTSLSPDDNNVGQQIVLPVLRFPVDIQEDTIRECYLASFLAFSSCLLTLQPESLSTEGVNKYILKRHNRFLIP